MLHASNADKMSEKFTPHSAIFFTLAVTSLLGRPNLLCQMLARTGVDMRVALLIVAVEA